ncbi:hypothetical protein DXG01_005768 [Tephrocybe rancida]|nr:hypothetical protein DXG01_005768 [Tephrocybe rancida]
MKALRDPQATIKITTSEYVSEIVDLKELPSHWNPSKHTKAYQINLSDATAVEGSPKNIIGQIRADEQCSWDGSSGHAKGDVYLHNIFPGHEKVLCQRAQLKCQSIKMCQFFDHECLVGYESFDMDDDKMKEYWDEELDANEEETRLPQGPEAQYNINFE